MKVGPPVTALRLYQRVLHQKPLAVRALQSNNLPAGALTVRHLCFLSCISPPYMWLIRYSRLLAQLLLLLTCAPIGIWQIQLGHRWAPVILFLVYLCASSIIRRTLPAPNLELEQIQRIRTASSSWHRVLAISNAVGLSILTVLLLLARFRMGQIPPWLLVLPLVFGWFWVWYHFRTAKVLKKPASASAQVPQKSE